MSIYCILCGLEARQRICTTFPATFCSSPNCLMGRYIVPQIKSKTKRLLAGCCQAVAHLTSPALLPACLTIALSVLRSRDVLSWRPDSPPYTESRRQLQLFGRRSRINRANAAACLTRGLNPSFTPVKLKTTVKMSACGCQQVIQTLGPIRPISCSIVVWS